MRPRFEPEPSRRRYRWIWPLLVAVVTVGLVGGVLFGGPWYLLILAAFSVAPLTAVAPLRESAIVLASGWGTMRLGEGRDRRETIRRIGASALVVCGAILLAIDG